MWGEMWGYRRGRLVVGVGWFYGDSHVLVSNRTGHSMTVLVLASHSCLDVLCSTV